MKNVPIDRCDICGRKAVVVFDKRVYARRLYGYDRLPEVVRRCAEHEIRIRRCFNQPRYRGERSDRAEVY